MSSTEEKQTAEDNNKDGTYAITILDDDSSSFEKIPVADITKSGNFSPNVSLENEGQDIQEPTVAVVEPRNFADGKSVDQQESLSEVDNDARESTSSMDIICSGSYKTSAIQQQDIQSYTNIPSNPFIHEANQDNMNNQEISNVENEGQNASIITEEEASKISMVANQSQEIVQDETKSIFNSVTELNSSSDSNQQQTTFLHTQTINPEQNSQEHAILSGTEISDGFSDAFQNGQHYIVQGLQSVQAINQPGNASVVLLQVPGSQNTSQVVVAQLTNGQIQHANMPDHITQVQPEADGNAQQNVAKRGRGRGRGKGKAKPLKQENVPLRPLAPRMFAVPISSPVLIAGPSGNTQVFTPVDQLQQMTSVTSNQVTRTAGQHFEVLGRCIMCFRFCRTTTYCRAEKNHTDVRAAACTECEEKGNSTVVCRRKRQHKSPNAYPPNIVINVALQRSADLKDMCLKNLLPPCFSDLHSLTVHHADCIFAQPRMKSEPEDSLMGMDGEAPSESSSYRKPTDYARGYLYPYSKEAWEQWLEKFCLQTGTSYRIRTGKRVNKKTDHGLANHNGKIVVYRALETQLYNCALGGKPRRKALREGSRRRKARGSKLIGCSAVIHTRLIVTEEEWKALEITLPKLSAHLPVHDPRMTSNDIQPDMSSMMLSSSLYSSDQGVTSSEQEEFAILGDVSFHTDTETDLSNDQIHLLNSLQFDNMKKQTKSLMAACDSLIDEMSSYESLKTAHFHVQTLLNQLKRSIGHKRPRKRTAVEANLVNDEVLEEGESRPASVNQVVLIQTDHD